MTLKEQLAEELKVVIEQVATKNHTYIMSDDGDNEIFIDGDIDLGQVAEKLVEKGWAKPS